MAAVEQGQFVVLQGPEAAERIREVYALATSLRADFRRVEDSWREADRQLRQTIVSEQTHRGEIVDKLLDGHDDLLDSAEGRVFHAFHQQLGHSIQLDNMKQRLRTILRHPATQSALTRVQQVPHAGMNAEGVRFSATWFVTKHWLLNVDAAIDRLRDDAAASPVTQERTQRVLNPAFACSH